MKSHLFIIAVAIALLGTALRAEDSSPRVSYNGIAVPDVWPPKVELTRKPLATPPYLVSPPPVVLINVGRQLFVDDFLIESTTLTRTHHLPVYYSGNPVMTPDQPWERVQRKGKKDEDQPRHAAMFSDGVWFDPADQLYKMWYWAGALANDAFGSSTCLATSRDGIKWDKPKLDVVPGTNIVLLDEPKTIRNSSTVWLDLDEKDPARRFKMFRVCRDGPRFGTGAVPWRLRAAFSPDGIHWTIAGDSDGVGDRTTVFRNPFRDVWVASLRRGDPATQARCRAYFEDRDPLAALHWEKTNPRRDVLWIGADELDPDRADLDLNRPANRVFDLTPSQLYNLDCVAYESIMLGMFTTWRGQPKTRPKINEVCIGYSRDGFHWSRPDRRAFCPVSEDKAAWNWGNVQSAGGCCLIVGDKLRFYVGGVGTIDGKYFPDPMNVGMAELRRDGFTSMDAGPNSGTLTTRTVKFTGKHLFVNVAASAGELRAELLDDHGHVIAPFTSENCGVVKADTTRQRISWKGAENFGQFAGRLVKFRFHLTNGQLYAFWVSQDESGASRGYVAAGGPGFTGSRDVAGAR